MKKNQSKNIKSGAKSNCAKSAKNSTKNNDNKSAKKSAKSSNDHKVVKKEIFSPIITRGDFTSKITSSDLTHDSSISHVEGRSEFVGDRPLVEGEVWVDFYYSPFAHAKILKIDLEAAMKLPGVLGIFTAQDLKHNAWGSTIADQPILVEEVCNYIGEPVVVVAAINKECARRARQKISVSWQELTPIFTIDEAINRESFLAGEQRIVSGDLRPFWGSDRTKKKNKSADSIHYLEGVFCSGGQEHFYFETQSVVVYPLEGDCLEIHSSTQHPSEVQHVVAHTLGLTQQQVVCIVKRLGGGFGGKESQAAHYAALAALVAHKLKRPARLILDRDDDMKITGKRHPFQTHYKVAFDEEGHLLGLAAKLFADGGAYLDLSAAILQRALFHIDNAYYIPNAELVGRICRTNFPPNTAFRGFGAPQGMAVIENIIEEIADYLGKDSLQIRKINCYAGPKRNITPYGQKVENITLPKLYAQIEKSADYYRRKQEISKHNQECFCQGRMGREEGPFLRGIGLTPAKFGISFTATFLNQGSALINVYRDGSVQVSTGAVEMGQGVYAKIKQVVADTFRIDPKLVRVMPTSTEKNANTSPTAASSGADINCSAALKAALEIKSRLDKVESSMQSGGGRGRSSKLISFKELVEAAYFQRIDLGAHSFYSTPDIYFDSSKGRGNPFYYFTQGIAVSEVEIDVLTGVLKVVRADILMDLGRPINRALDFGQICGAFIQGMGWITSENLFYSQQGELLSHSPTTYKIPNIGDVPPVFNVDLLENNECKNVYGSKAVGEPPFVLSLSIWAAIRHALSFTPEVSSRIVSKNQILPIPATAEEVLFRLRPIT